MTGGGCALRCALGPAPPSYPPDSGMATGGFARPARWPELGPKPSPRPSAGSREPRAETLGVMLSRIATTRARTQTQCGHLDARAANSLASRAARPRGPSPALRPMPPPPPPEDEAAVMDVMGDRRPGRRGRENNKRDKR